MAESCLFQQLKLQPGQPLEVYHATIVEKGAKLGKNNIDIMAKFISGLPDRLAFFVRTGRPFDHQAALVSAKMGEAYGYREPVQTQPSTDSFVPPPTNPGLQQLSETLGKLQEQVNTLSVKFQESGNNHDQAKTYPNRNCYNCGGAGHTKRDCNWIGNSAQRPDLLCQLCHQKGHGSFRCRYGQTPSVPRRPSFGKGPTPQGN